MVAGSTIASYRTYGVPGEPPGVIVPGVVGMLLVAVPGVAAGGTVVSPGVTGVVPGVIGPVGPGLPGATGVELRGIPDGGGAGTGEGPGFVGLVVSPDLMSSGPGESVACFTGLCACDADPAPEPIALPEPTPASLTADPEPRAPAGAASAVSTPARNEVLATMPVVSTTLPRITRHVGTFFIRQPGAIRVPSSSGVRPCASCAGALV